MVVPYSEDPLRSSAGDLSRQVIDPRHLRQADFLERVQRSSSYLLSKINCVPHSCVVLGSGLSRVADIVEDRHEIIFDEIPGFSRSTVDGHAGKFIFGRVNGVPQLFQQGRLHLYEGLPADEVILPIHVAVTLGIRKFILTNAIGSLSPNILPGSIVLLTNILAGQMPDPFTNVAGPGLGTMFSDCTNPFDKKLSSQIGEILSSWGISVSEGTFAWMAGPRYDSAAEIADLQARAWIIENILKKPKLAPKVVGMSMAPEVVWLNHIGEISIIGLSFVSNFAAGVSDKSLNHAEVLAVGANFSVLLGSALKSALKELN